MFVGFNADIMINIVSGALTRRGGVVLGAVAEDGLTVIGAAEGSL